MPTAQELADAFGCGCGARLIPVARGAMGAIWRLETAEGTFAAKQLFRNPPDPYRVEAEIRLVGRARDEGVDSQVAVAAPDGRYVVPAAGELWRLYEWIDGDRPDDTADTAEWLVRQAARVHRAAVPGVPYGPDDDWYHRVRVDWPATVGASRGRPWEERLSVVLADLVELSAFVNGVPVAAGVSCHRDVQRNNALRDGAGRLWLLDWDNHGPLEPWREFGALLLDAVPDPDELARLAAAYRDETAIEVPDGPELFATGIATWLNFLAGQTWIATHQQESDEQVAWSSQMVELMLGRFPTLSELAAAGQAVAAEVSGSRAAGRA